MAEDKAPKKYTYDWEGIEAPDYSDEEHEMITTHSSEMLTAKNQRDTWHIEFDEQTYKEYNESNSRAANAYIAPKKNQQDTRIVTGTTREKTLTLQSTLLNYNYEPNIQAYNKDNMEEYKLGEVMEAAIKKSNDLEDPTYEEKRTLIYKEMLDQGDAFIEDVWEERSTPKKSWSGDATRLEGHVIEKGREVHKALSTNLIPGINFYPGNIKEYYMNKQPFIFVRKVLSRGEAESVFGEFARWANVPKVLSTMENSTEGDMSIDYMNWYVESVKKDKVEVLQYQNKWTNEYQVYCNGIPMLPAGYPLSELNGVNDYTVKKLSAEPISKFFFYSKSTPAKTKVDQAVFDELYRLMLLKTRQSFMPPIANNTGRQITAEIFFPATVVDNIDPNELQPLIDANGVSSGEFNFVEFVKRVVDEKSVNPIFEGQSIKGEQTAREVNELQRRQLVKLAVLLQNVTMYERERAALRLQNILKYWTDKEMDGTENMKGEYKALFEKFEVSEKFEDGTEGVRMIEFKEKDLHPEQVRAREKLLSKPGRSVRITRVNPKLLKQRKYKWKIVIEPTEKDSSSLERLEFEESLLKAMRFFPQTVNMAYMQGEFAKHAKWDKDKAFMAQQQPMSPMAMQPPAGQQGKRQTSQTTNIR